MSKCIMQCGRDAAPTGTGWCSECWDNPDKHKISLLAERVVRLEALLAEWMRATGTFTGDDDIEYCCMCSLRTENARLRKALTWYANARNYNGFCAPMDTVGGVLVPDEGRRASEALKHRAALEGAKDE